MIVALNKRVLLYQSSFSCSAISISLINWCHFFFLAQSIWIIKFCAYISWKTGVDAEVWLESEYFIRSMINEWQSEVSKNLASRPVQKCTQFAGDRDVMIRPELPSWYRIHFLNIPELLSKWFITKSILVVVLLNPRHITI